MWTNFYTFFTVKFIKNLWRKTELKLYHLPVNLLPHYLVKRKWSTYTIPFILVRMSDGISLCTAEVQVSVHRYKSKGARITYVLYCTTNQHSTTTNSINRDEATFQTSRIVKCRKQIPCSVMLSRDLNPNVEI